jgi:hypothetical protein
MASFPADEFFDDLDGTCADEVDWGDVEEDEDADVAFHQPLTANDAPAPAAPARASRDPTTNGLVGSIGHGASGVGGSHAVAMEEKSAAAYARFYDLKWHSTLKPLEVTSWLAELVEVRA